MEKHLRIIRKLPLWSDRDILVETLSGGITNFNYLIQDDGKKYVARFAPKQNILLGLKRAREIYNTNIAASLGLGPKVISFSPRHNLLIVEYIEGRIFSPKIARGSIQIRSVAKLLRKLHAGPRFRGEFNPFKTIREYILLVKRRRAWLPSDIGKLLDELREVEKKVGKFYRTYPCHLDLVLENIVGDKQGVRLLDWEYSANSDYRFDLAMLSVKGNFNSRQDELLLKEYGNTSESLYDQVQTMKAVVCFREAAWGLLQVVISKIKFDYKNYAVENFSLFRLFAAKAKNNNG